MIAEHGSWRRRLAVALLGAVTATGFGPARADDARLLLLGNSYTSRNDLDQLVAGARRWSGRSRPMAFPDGLG